MLTTYFKHPFTLRKLRSDPAGPYLDDFASQLTQSGYCRNKIRAHLRGAGRFSAWSARAGLTIETLDSLALAQFRQCLDTQGHLRYRRGEYSNTFVGARHFVGFLQVSGIVSPPAPVVEPELLTIFCHWMHAHRGVTEITLNNYRPALLRLLDTLGDNPEHYTAKQLRGFVLDRTRGHKTSQARTTVTVLRMFLRCLIAQGLCTSELLLAIPTIAGWRRASLPRYLSAEEIERVIDTCDGETTIGARDRAVLLLLARLGLRSSDVANLKLNDIDWEQGLFHVAGKNRASATTGCWRGAPALLNLPSSVCRHFPRLYYYHCTVRAFFPLDSQRDYRARITPRPDRRTVLRRSSPAPLSRHRHAAPGSLDGGHRCRAAPHLD